MTYEPEPRKTFLVPSGTYESPDRKHLFIIMTKACADAQHLLLSVSSIKAGVKYDTTCELMAGCHSFITKPSYVLYTKAEKRSTKGIRKCVDRWYFTPKEILDSHIFQQICDGIDKSPFTPRWAKEYYCANAE